MHTELELRRMKGQAIKDIWHAMIGKGPGIKNTTGLKTTDDVIHAILKYQEDPDCLKYKEMVPSDIDPMPPKKKPGVSKEKQEGGVKVEALESTELPILVSEVIRSSVHTLYIKGVKYFLDSKQKIVYTSLDNRPGEVYGSWDPETRTIQES